MSKVTIDPQTGALVIAGRKVFPIGFSEPPPLGGKTPSGVAGLKELKDAGGNVIRTGPWDFGTPAAPEDWSTAKAAAQIAKVKARLDEAQTNGLLAWLFLGKAPNLPPDGAASNEQLLETIVGALKGHPALAAYKGFDEPAWGHVKPGGLVAAFNKLKHLDPDHPVVIIQAPRQQVAALVPYQPAFDVTGVDIYPVAYPPANHSGGKRDISVVGDMTKKMMHAAGGKPVWTTLQIAWTGTVRSQKRPNTIPCFPTLHDERFMAYHAIVSGARGLMFFGGHLTQVCSPEDAKLGWNWSFWRRVLRPVVIELGSADLNPALVAPNAQVKVTTKVHGKPGATDIELVTRRAGNFLYVIAVKTGSSGTPVIDFAGLPKSITKGSVLFEFVQDPPPRPYMRDKQVPRGVKVTNGGFQDCFRPHDVHVYRFAV